mgnify:CR=1 FL=1
MIPPLVSFMLELGANSNLEDSTRDSAMFFVGWAITYKNSIVLQQKLMEPIFNVLFKMMLEEDADGLDINDITPYRSACSLLDQLCISMPSKYIFNPVIGNSMKLLASDNWVHRKAGISAVGLVVEGCSEATRKHLQNIVPHVRYFKS